MAGSAFRPGGRCQGYDLDEYVYAGLKAGGSGFLLKDAEQERVVDAVRTVAAGGESAPLRRLGGH